MLKKESKYVYRCLLKGKLLFLSKVNEIEVNING